MCMLTLLHFHPTLALSDTASVNMTISSQNIQNGSLLTLTATCDPIVGANTLRDLKCKYSDPAGGTATVLTAYNSFKKQIVKRTSLSAYNKARFNITSPGNPMILVFSPITFDDEKRVFSCTLEYYDPDGNFQTPITSEQHRLENVYSEWLLFSFMLLSLFVYYLIENTMLFCCFFEIVQNDLSVYFDVVSILVWHSLALT